MKNLASEYKFRNLGKIQSCLGLQIVRDSSGNYGIHQSDYIKRMGEKFNILVDKRAKTPLSANKFDENAEKVDSTEYRSLIGAILYVSVATRPDITNSVSTLAQFNVNPTVEHMKAARRLIAYLLNTIDYKIIYDKSQDFAGYADAERATCQKTGRSTSGYFLSFRGGPVLWGSHRQKVIAFSIAEAEYMSMATLGRFIVYATQLIKELQYDHDISVMYVPLYEDCEPAIRIAEKPGFTQRSVSIRLSYHMYIIRELVRDKIVKIHKIPGHDQPADILTKSLSKAKTFKFCQHLFRFPKRTH